MEEKKVITSHIDELKNFDWLTFMLKDDDDINFVNSKETVMEASKLWGISAEAVEAIRDAFAFMTESFVDHIKEDLMDIWKRSNDANFRIN